MKVYENGEFKGFWVSPELWQLRGKLNYTEIFFLSLIGGEEKNKGSCTDTNDELAKFFNLSRSRSSEILQRLKKKGFISITHHLRGKQHIGRDLRVIKKMGNKQVVK